MKRIKLKSGLTGWQARLHENYEDFQDFFTYDQTYGLAKRLGYKNAVEVWNANPLICGGINPSDFSLVGEGPADVDPDISGMRGEYICTACGGNNITGTGNISWSIKKQEWQFESCMDKGDYCEDCDSDTRAEFVILKGQKKKKVVPAG